MKTKLNIQSWTLSRFVWRSLFLQLSLLSCMGMLKSADFQVTNSNDAGLGSLRQAITDANNNGPGLDNIQFNISGIGPHSISLNTQLPIITSSVNIDGATQPGYTGQPLIEINGAGNAADGLSFLNSGSNTVKALAINRCTSNGIYMSGGAGTNTIQGCYIGTDVTGTIAIPNDANGISIVNNGGNLIGGTGVNDGNIIANNLGNGISLLGASCSFNILHGNYIGTNPGGDMFGNLLNGLRIIDGSDNQIGGNALTQANVIAFNEINGILVYRSSSTPLNNAFLRNSIYSNNDLGIDLGNDGVSLNDVTDSDAGANALQNWPYIDEVSDDGTDTHILGHLNSTAAHDFQIDIYRNDLVYSDAFYGEGHSHLNSIVVTTDASGDATFSITLPGIILTGTDRLSATATRLIAGSPKATSEFGLNWVFEESDCSDGIDNDGDGLIDCADPDCSMAGQAYTWYFGENAALTFENEGTPVQLISSSLSVSEGCGAMSDDSGDLLFYTGGSTLFNAEHSPMPNGSGLFGHTSASQSGVMIQDPGNADRYYVFTNRDRGAEVHYSIVDMTLDGGKGDVLAAYKNVFVKTGDAEKLAAWPHANGTDMWVVMADQNNLYSYQVTSTGLLPVVSSPAPSNGRVYGYMKFSADGTRLVSGDYENLDSGSQISLYDFDNATGQFANPLSWPVSEPYGVEFSPDGKYLYAVDQGWFSAPAVLYQYTIRGKSTAADIVASQEVLFSTSSYHLNALQLAPDGKIYVATSIGFSSRNGLGVINHPTALGTASDFVEDQITFANGAASTLGLPNFPAYQINSVPVAGFVSTSDTCIGVAQLSASASGAISYHWLLDEVAISGAIGSTYMPASTGDYRAVATYFCGSDTSNVISFLPDNDSDCYADIYDLDDDNDGILDRDECNGTFVLDGAHTASIFTANRLTTTASGNTYDMELRNGVTFNTAVGPSQSNTTFGPPPPFNGPQTYFKTEINTINGVEDHGTFTVDFPELVIDPTVRISGLSSHFVAPTWSIYMISNNPSTTMSVIQSDPDTYLAGDTIKAEQTPSHNGTIIIQFIGIVDHLEFQLGHYSTTGDDGPVQLTVNIGYIQCDDVDADGVTSMFDLDSDNDGIYDAMESGSMESQIGGVLDGGVDIFGIPLSVSDGTSGLTYSYFNTDATGYTNPYDSDSDGDSCPDVNEAGFPDPDGDAQLGGLVPPTVDGKGVVTSGGL